MYLVVKYLGCEKVRRSKGERSLQKFNIFWSLGCCLSLAAVEGLTCGVTVGVLTFLFFTLLDRFQKPTHIDEGSSNLFLRAFASMGILPCLYFGVVGFIISGYDPAAFCISMLGGVAFGLILAGVLVPSHYSSVNKLNPDYIERLLGIHQVSTFNRLDSLEEAYQSICERVNSSNFFRVAKASKELGVIEIRGASIFGIKSNHTTIFLSTQNDKTVVTLTSGPLFETALVDQGDSIKIVRELSKIITKQS